MELKMNNESIHSFSRYLAVTGIMLIVVIIVMIIVVTLHRPHVCLVEHRTDQSLVYVRSGMERMLHDVDLGSSPFDDQDEAVYQRRCCADVEDRKSTRLNSSH